MTATKTPVTFLNKDGLRLFGILHEPEVRRDPDTAILLLSPGVKMRVAPHRLYAKMAARFVELGYPVLRFDFHGLGDAEGTAPEALLADLYGATQVGRYVADTVAAMDWMQRTYGTSRFIASGLCGGALTGLLAAQIDPRITSLVALSIPVILDGSNIDSTNFMTVGQLKGTRNRYLMKLRVWDPDVWRSWLRFFSMQSHYSLILRSLWKPSARLFARARADRPTQSIADGADNTNPHFAPAFLRMISTSRPVLLLFAESDRLLWEFQVKFYDRQRSSIEQFKNEYDVQIIPQANHIFSFAEWQADALDRVCGWLQHASISVVAGVR